MFDTEFRRSMTENVLGEFIKELEKRVPEDVKEDIRKMTACQVRITARIRGNKALSSEDVKLYNDMCYKHFGKLQDGEEFTKEESEPETKTPVTQRRFDFGEAIHMLKDGYKLARDGWNGKEQYIILAKNIKFDTYDVKNWPVLHEAIGSKAIAFVGTSGVQMGWLASQADMLAEDWHCVEDKK